ncbi:hypothetical protein PILCRDRAFT_14011 [Piloderma croceum F 1598]|uniref:Uncharacterized protein n=1 Tax=Piloderma croceum (strain F 1598) TaxID=765440 RepID=A0A0C3AM20_PILCF|nr:hypothetical protein PILCRDRAFT_14011 [Piloderma croceum F 1598]
MAKPKRKPDGRTSRVLQGDSRESHQVPDNPTQLPIWDSIGNEEPTLPDLCRSSHIQAAASNTLVKIVKVILNLTAKRTLAP